MSRTVHFSPKHGALIGMIGASFTMGFLEQAATGQHGNVNFSLIRTLALLPFMLSWIHLDAKARHFELSALFRIALGFVMALALPIYFFLSRRIVPAITGTLFALVWYVLIGAVSLGGASLAQNLFSR